MSKKVLITKEKIDNVANKVLDITGETSGKTLDELNTTLTNVNNEISTQGDLIAQLQAAVDSLPEAGGGSGEDVTAEVSGYTNKIASLESAVASLETELANKASGGTGGGGTESTETCILNITTDYQWYCGISYQGIDGWHVRGGSSKNYNISAICGSTVMVYQDGFYKAEISAGIILAEQSSTGFVYQVPNTPNETITINIITD